MKCLAKHTVAINVMDCLSVYSLNKNHMLLFNLNTTEIVCNNSEFTTGCFLNYFAGAVVTVFTQRFVITGADLFVYHFMQSNPEKFPQAIIDNIRNYMIQMGHLKEENTDSACNIEQEHEKSFAHI
jgi:hypothetical protein